MHFTPKTEEFEAGAVVGAVAGAEAGAEAQIDRQMDSVIGLIAAAASFVRLQ